MTDIAAYTLPVIITLSGIMLAFSKKDLFSLFLSGCSDGLKTTAGILPTLIMLVVAVKMLSASGALEATCSVLSPLCVKIGIPEEVLPVVLMRPVSGSGATAMIKELFDNSGPDSAAGRIASVLMGSSDTIIYTLSLYFSHVGAKKTGYALPAAFILMIFCLFVSCFICSIF